MANTVDILISARDEATSVLNKVGNAIAGIGRQAAAFALAQAGLMGVQAALEKAGEAFIGYNAKMEQTRISMETMLGSAEAAQTFMSQMADFAERTPFEFKDVADAAKKFLAFGWAARDVIPTLTAVGNAAAALGIQKEGIDRITLALGQMGQKSKLSGEEIRQLNEAGIGAQKYLADAFNLTADAFDDLSKTGITGAQAVKAIVDGMANDPKFKDMMEKQSKTAIGLWSTLKDQASTIFGAIGQTSFDAMKGVLEAVTGSLTDIVKKIRESGVAKAFEDLVPPEWQARIEKVFNIVASYWDALMTALKRGSTGGASALDLVGKAIDFLVPIMEGFYNVVAFVFDAVVGIWNNTAAVADQFVTDLIEGFTGLYNDTIGIWNALGSGITWIWDNIVVTIWGKVKNFVVGVLDMLGPLGKIIEGVGSAISDAWVRAAEGPKVSSTGSAWKNFLGGMKGPGGATQAGLDALNAHNGTKMDLEPGVDKAAAKAAEKLENIRQKMTELVADLDAKILEQTGTALEVNLAKLKAEVTKMQNDINDAKAGGADVTDAQAKLNTYNEAAQKKIKDDVKKAQNELIQDTALVNATLTADAQKVAEATYQAALASIEKEIEAKKKAGIEIAEVDKWAEAKRKEATQARDKSIQEETLADYQRRIEHNNNLAQLEGRTTAQIAALNKQVLEEKIKFLDEEIKKAKDNKDLAIKLEKEKADALAQINQQKRYDMTTVAGEAVKEIMNQQFDFANLMVNTWNTISSTVSNHLKGILTETEKLGDGMKAIFKDVTMAIVNMFLEIAIQELIMAPLKSWFTGIITGGKGHKATGGRVFGGTPYTVGEHGEETFVPDTGGWIVPNGAMSGTGGPSVVMNISTPNAESFRQSQTQIFAAMNGALAQGRRNL